MSFIKKIRNLFKADQNQKGASLVGLPQAYEQKQKFQIEFLKNAGLLSNMHFVDIGCGVLRGGLPVIEYLEPAHYVGLDVNKEALAIGKNLLREKSLELKKANLISVEHKISDISLPMKADMMWAFSVLIHMTDDHVIDCLKFVSENLKSGGCFYANVNIGESQDGKWKHFPVKWRGLDWYSTEGKKVGLRVESIGTLSDFGHKSLSDAREDIQQMLKFSPL